MAINSCAAEMRLAISAAMTEPALMPR